MVDKLLNEKQVSEIIGVSVHKLRANRNDKVGIPFVKMGRNVRYREADVQSFIERRVVQTTTGK